MTNSILDRILATKRDELITARRARSVIALKESAWYYAPPRDFHGAVAKAAGPTLRVIAEVKRASPSGGVIRAVFNPAEIAATYQRCGAAAVSVLTDRVHFQGELQHVRTVKDAVSLPILRKDFVIDEYQIHESRASGADAILLIAGILQPSQIEEWSQLAEDLGMTCLVEVHDETQLDSIRSLFTANRRIILGINNRDLRTQRTDIGTTLRLSSQIDRAVVFISESGIKTREDVLALQQSGAKGALIGETLLRSTDMEATYRELFG